MSVQQEPDAGAGTGVEAPSTPSRPSTANITSPPTQTKSRFNLQPQTDSADKASSDSNSNGTIGLGAKSMPGKPRSGAAAGVADETFGLDKLSLGNGEPVGAGAGGEGGVNGTGVGGKEEDVGAEGARDSVNFLMSNEDEGYVPAAKRDGAKAKLSTSSSALDLAPLSQTSQRYPHRPFDTGLKTSEWPQFSGIPKSANDATRPASGPTIGNAPGGQGTTPSVSRRESPTGATGNGNATGNNGDMSASITSLPGAMPSRSVPGTPGAGLVGGGLGGFSQFRKPGPGGPGMGGVAGGQALEGLSTAQRGFSNPDLAKAFQKNVPGPGFGSIAPGQGRGKKNYGPPDPLYANMEHAHGHGMVPSLGGPQFGGYEGYGFEDDGAGFAGGPGMGAVAWNGPVGGGMGGGMMGMGQGQGNMGGGQGQHRGKKGGNDMDREYNRFSGMRLEDLQGEILSLSKDQHGCRYLQKKLEEEVPDNRDMIFREVYGHFPELMTDPFGNYLCQKLLEYSSEEQRNAICESVANDLVGISLNMHGTRAVQKMIDFLCNPRQPTQIRSIILALSLNVVALIKDLNGNHVIQKCLNRLIPEDNQFIYNAVAAHCIEVATHRHGCCVLQRCIDHATDQQRIQLVTEITFHALTLVQDPFGNYVVQYVLDLNDVRFSEPLIRQFVGNVCVLSVQKFSSNVIEKCIRVADPELRKVMVAELLSRGRLEKLLRDSFANYVVQTALDYAEPQQRVALVDHIRPILPMIRNTPYGKRIQSKLQREQHGNPHDHFGGATGGFPGQQNMMNLGMNNFGGNAYGGGGRGGFQQQHHPRLNNHHNQGHNPNHNPNHGHNIHHGGMNDFYGGGPAQGLGQGMGFGGYQGAMGGGFDMGFQQHLNQQQFGGPHFGQGQNTFGAHTGADSAFPAGPFAPGPVDQPDLASLGNIGAPGLPNMGIPQLDTTNNVQAFQPQQTFAPYM